MTSDFKSVCDPDMASLKAYFLGPQAENGEWFLKLMQRIMSGYIDWRQKIYPQDGCAISASDRGLSEFVAQQAACEGKLTELIQALENETPKFTPRYLGHMVSEVAIPSILGHFLLLLHNPNNVSPEASKVGSQIEDKAIQALCRLVGYRNSSGVGHLTSGGTVANFEALWRARYRVDHWISLGAWLRVYDHSKQAVAPLAMMGWARFEDSVKRFQVDVSDLRTFSPVASGPWLAGDRLRQAFGAPYLGPVVLVSGNKHYSWEKGVSLLGLGEEAFWQIQLDAQGKMKVANLKEQIQRAVEMGRPIMMVVSVCGTTELGEIDPIDQVQDLLDDYAKVLGYHIWHHVDGAYGGFYAALLGEALTEAVLAPEVRQALRALGRVDSITIDPHKLGYIPYACGAILLKSREHDRIFTPTAPYLLKDDTAYASWPNIMEGSRSATGAGAVWLLEQTLGFGPKGLGGILKIGIEGRIEFARRLSKVRDLYLSPGPDTNILCFCIARRGESLSRSNRRTLEIFQRFISGPSFSISKTSLSTKHYQELVTSMLIQWQGEPDTDELILLRMVLMNPFFMSKEMNLDWCTAFIDELLRNVADSSL